MRGETWDVAVIGAGPAGSMAARAIARQGRSVLLVDRSPFPRGKVCGCCLNGAALKALDRAGLGALPVRLGGQPLRTFRLAGAGRQVSLPLPLGTALSREALDTALAGEAVREGACFLPATRASLAGKKDGYRALFLRQKDREWEIRARVVVAADGLNGNLAERECPVRVLRSSRIGAGTLCDEAPPFYREGTIFMASGKQGYVGAVRLEDGRLDLAAAFDPRAVHRTNGLGALAAETLQEAGFPPVPGLPGLSWRGTPMLTRFRPLPAGERLFLVGDSAGYMEPFTGEGIAWALAGGLAVAPLAAEGARRWDGALALRWSRFHRMQIRRRQWLCRALTLFLRSPSFTREAVRFLSAFPALAGPAVRALNTPLEVPAA